MSSRDPLVLQKGNCIQIVIAVQIADPNWESGTPKTQRP